MSFDVELLAQSSPLVLIGPNGSGKTSLLRALAGARHPFQGRIELLGRTLFDSSRRIDLPPEQRKVGYVPQGYGLFPHMSVKDNVGFGCRDDANASTSVARALGRLGVAHLAHRLPGELSGGEMQKVALARALVTEPDMLLLDEPLSALDPRARRELRAHLAEQVATEVPVVLFVSHDVRDVSAIGGAVSVLERGRIVQRGSCQELAAEPESDFVAEFFAPIDLGT
jgi:ABC-type sulfate/molybdate transport systems ATPase subunit